MVNVKHPKDSQKKTTTTTKKKRTHLRTDSV